MSRNTISALIYHHHKPLKLICETEGVLGKVPYVYQFYYVNTANSLNCLTMLDLSSTSSA
jgi:hypothetical protein